MVVFAVQVESLMVMQRALLKTSSQLISLWAPPHDPTADDASTEHLISPRTAHAKRRNSPRGRSAAPATQPASKSGSDLEA